MKRFLGLMRVSFGIKNLNHLEITHVRHYFQYLAGQVQRQVLRTPSARNVMSFINTTLCHMTRGRHLHVMPSDYLVSKKTKRAKRSNSAAVSEYVKTHLSNLGARGLRLLSIIGLQRQLGLRFEESLKLDCRRAMAEAENTGVISVWRGTKGGQRRTLKATPDMMHALQQALPHQGSHDTLIPVTLREATFRKQCYAMTRDTGLDFHAHRHDWANDCYEREAGFVSPRNYRGTQPFLQALAQAKGLSTKSARALDRAARLEVSRQLGHHRGYITNVYLGGSHAQ